MLCCRELDQIVKADFHMQTAVPAILGKAGHHGPRLLAYSMDQTSKLSFFFPDPLHCRDGHATKNVASAGAVHIVVAAAMLTTQAAADQVGNHANASLLGIPPEIRLLIYDHFLQSCSKTVQPVPQSKASRTGGHRNHWVLLKICKLTHREALPLMPHVTDLTFELFGLSEQALKAWLSSMGDARIGQIRNLLIDGEGLCAVDYTDVWDEDLSATDSEAVTIRPCCSRALDILIKWHPLGHGREPRENDDSGDDQEWEFSVRFEHFSDANELCWSCNAACAEFAAGWLDGVMDDVAGETEGALVLASDDVVQLWAILNANVAS